MTKAKTSICRSALSTRQLSVSLFAVYERHNRICDVILQNKVVVCQSIKMILTEARSRRKRTHQTSVCVCLCVCARPCVFVRVCACWTPLYQYYWLVTCLSASRSPGPQRDNPFQLRAPYSRNMSAMRSIVSMHCCSNYNSIHERVSLTCHRWLAGNKI